MTNSSATVPSRGAIERAAHEFQFTLNEQQVLQIQQYTKSLWAWNEKVNLTAIRDPLEMLYRHFCESMFGAGLLPVENCRLADVGCGGGFPGLRLKILLAERTVLLTDANVQTA